MKFRSYDHQHPLPSLGGLEVPFRPLYEAFNTFRGFETIFFVAYDDEGEVLGLLPGCLMSLLPFYPSLFRTLTIIGHGTYRNMDPSRRVEVFHALLHYVTESYANSTFAIRFRYMEEDRFAYKAFHEEGFVPIYWISVYNSVHDRAPETRLFEVIKRRIQASVQRGFRIRQACSDFDYKTGAELLHHHYKHQSTFTPSLAFINQLVQVPEGCPKSQMLLIEKDDRVIGASLVYPVGDDLYLLAFGGKRRGYKNASPHIMAVWAALNHAYLCGYRHLRFLNGGFPFRANPTRDFMLSFGGTQQSRYRWYRFRWRWMNGFIQRLYS